MSLGRLFVGTSGFAYKEWVGPFYPLGTKSTGMLRHYAGQFRTVELNYTFRRLPSPSALSGWAAQTPQGFVFACKANQRITHHARLQKAEEPLRQFLEAVSPLGERLGPVLFQCPPTLRYDAGVLDAFLDLLPAGRRFAMEFRHPSFDTDEVRERLSSRGVAWCVADTETSGDASGPPGQAPARFVRTAPDFAYLRLRRGDYDEAALVQWGRAVGEALEAGVDVYAYLKHEDSAAGPRDAAILRAAASG